MKKDYIIIGGGSAGIAAAYKILESSRTATVRILEATNGYGGRAKTDTKSIPGLAFDKGCVYIQDPKNPLNPWPKIAGQLGFTLVEEKDEEYKLRIDRGDGFETVDSTNFPEINLIVADIETQYEASKEFPNQTVTTEPDVLTEDNEFALALSPYGPFTESTQPWNYLAADRAREAKGDWGNNLFVEQGLGNLVKAYGEKLKPTFGARFEQTFKAVKEVIYNADKVTVVDSSGKRFVCDACIVTVPVSVIAADSIRFTPALPAAYTTALEALQLGSYKKLAVELRALPGDIADNTNYYMYNAEPNGIWQFYRESFFPKNVLVVHTSGDFAAALDGMTDRAVFDLFKETFTQAYADDEPEFTAKYGITQWSNDNYALGAYSFTGPIGRNRDKRTALDARKQMAKPIDNKVYFAGEAYNIKAYGTLHGAYVDGQDTAEDMLRTHED